jgi:hypothetical protein
MTDPSDRSKQGNGKQGSKPGNVWEQRAAEMAGDVQRWLIRSSAKNMRDEFSGQVRTAFRGDESKAGDPWETATTEPPNAADEPPECAWCPVCRAARRLADARADAGGGAGTRLANIADVMAGAVKDVLSGVDSVLSYRPEPGRAGDRPEPGRAGDRPEPGRAGDQPGVDEADDAEDQAGRAAER